MAIAEIKWKLVKDTYFFDTTTCYLSENGNHLFYVGKEKQIEILIDNLNELVRKGCAMWLKLGEYEFGLDKLSKCPTQTWYSIHQKLYSLEPWGVIKESKKYTTKSIKKSARKSMKEQFVGKGKGGYRKPDKTKFNSGICLDSNGVKHTVIFDTRVEDFIVWVDDDNYLMWYVSSPQSLLNNLAESDLDENLILDIVALWEKLSKKRIKN